jgi:hypothetical protein
VTRAHDLVHPCKIVRPADAGDYFEETTEESVVASRVWLRIRPRRPHEITEGERVVGNQKWVVYGYTRSDWQSGDVIEWTTTRSGEAKTLFIRSIRPAKNDRMQRLRCAERAPESSHA